MEKYEILNVIYSAIAEASPNTAELLVEKASDKTQDFFLVDLGLNSINYAEIASIVMGHFDITHTLDIFTHTNRISDLVEIFYDLIRLKTDEIFL
jgi:acyl carrier protein